MSEPKGPKLTVNQNMMLILSDIVMCLRGNIQFFDKNRNHGSSMEVGLNANVSAFNAAMIGLFSIKEILLPEEYDFLLKVGNFGEFAKVYLEEQITLTVGQPKPKIYLPGDPL